MTINSLKKIENYWDDQAKNISWFKVWDETLVWNPPYARWFSGGLLNASFNCLDIHFDNGNENKTAIIWESENGESRKISYRDLYFEVNRFANVLKKLGIKKSDIVILYLPMIIESVEAMLACARIGAVHSVVFGGFSDIALADRINETKAKLVITADFGLRRGKRIALKEVVDKAVEACPSVEKVIIIKRFDDRLDIVPGRDYLYSDLLSSVSKNAIVHPEKVEANHPLFILYTSGTTGKPKGIIHSTGGYFVHNYTVFREVFNPDDNSIFWCTADIGWITGHSYLVYAPLMHGITIFMYEGTPDFPNPEKWWSLIEKYKITTFYTSPTALRMLMKFGDSWFGKYNLSSLSLLGSVGEAINPEVWLWYYEKIGNSKCPIVDTWWQTETGGVMISPLPKNHVNKNLAGSATKPLKGIDMSVVGENGEHIGVNERGYLVVNNPWPGMMMGIHNDDGRYEENYWSKFPGRYYAGDFAKVDRDGNIWLLGRSDEVLNISGHRIGTLEIENAALDNYAVAEAAAVGVRDEIKGEAIELFVVLKDGNLPNGELAQDIKKNIKKLIGSFAKPKGIVFVQKLPKTRSGKIMRRILKAVVNNENIGDVATLEDGASVNEAIEAFGELSKMIIQRH